MSSQIRLRLMNPWCELVVGKQSGITHIFMIVFVSMCFLAVGRGRSETGRSEMGRSETGEEWDGGGVGRGVRGAELIRNLPVSNLSDHLGPAS